MEAGGASGVGLFLAESGVAVSLLGSSLTDGDFSIEGMGVAGFEAATAAAAVTGGIGMWFEVWADTEGAILGVGAMEAVGAVIVEVITESV